MTGMTDPFGQRLLVLLRMARRRVGAGEWECWSDDDDDDDGGGPRGPGNPHVRSHHLSSPPPG